MRTFVFDLDDTLLGRSKRVGPDTHQVLLNRIQAGDRVIMATSRPIRGVWRFLDAMLVSQSIIITLNGAIHHDTSGALHQHSFLRDKAKNLITHGRFDNTLHYFIELQGECFATNAIYTDAELDVIHSATRDMVIPLDALDYMAVSKVALDGLGENLVGIIPFIQSLGLKPIPCLDGTFLNVVDPDVDKATTLAKVLQAIGVDRADTVVFGDDVPDIEMMRMGGISVAMGNAKPAVKAVADHSIGDCDEDGIGEFIRWITG